MKVSSVRPVVLAGWLAGCLALPGAADVKQVRLGVKGAT